MCVRFKIQLFRCVIRVLLKRSTRVETIAGLQVALAVGVGVREARTLARQLTRLSLICEVLRTKDSALAKCLEHKPDLYRQRRQDLCNHS